MAEADDDETDREDGVPWQPAAAGVAYAIAVGAVGAVHGIDIAHMLFLEVPLIFTIPWLFESVTVGKDGLAIKSRKFSRQITTSLKAISKVEIAPVALPSSGANVAALPPANLPLSGNLTMLHIKRPGSELLRDLALAAENELKTLARLARMRDDKSSLFLVIDLSDQHIVPYPMRAPLLAFLEAADAMKSGRRVVSEEATNALMEYGPDLIEKLRALRRTPEPLVYALQLRIRNGGDHREMGGLLSPPSIRIENTTIRIVMTARSEVPDNTIDIFVDRPSAEVVANPPYRSAPWGYIEGSEIIATSTARAMEPAFFDRLISG